MRRLVLTPQARRDAAAALKDSRSKFGSIARARYALLIRMAYQNLLDDPERQGVRRTPKWLQSYIFIISVTTATDHRQASAFKTHHIVAYKFDTDTLRVLRLLHDSMNVAARLEDSGTDEY